MKLVTENVEDHAKAISVMDMFNIVFHKYSVKGKRRNTTLFDTQQTEEEVTNKLKNRFGNEFVKAHLNRTNKTKMAPFILITEATVTLQDIRNIRAIGYIRIRAEFLKK